jgi:hypothetical protein
MPGTWIAKAIALAAATCFTLAPAPRAAAQSAGRTAAPKLTQLIRVFDATVVYPPPLWITSQESLLKESAIYPQQNRNVFIQEQIKKTETLANWTEMLKVIGTQTPEAQKIGVRQAMDRSVSDYRGACGKGSLALQIVHQETTSALFTVLCGNTPNAPKAFGYGDGVGEISVARLFIVKNTIVQVQYGWRGTKFDIKKQATWPVAASVVARATTLLETAEAY